MAQMTKDYVISQVLELLPIADDELYSKQVNILVSGAINKLRIEGVDIEAQDKDGEYIFQDNNFYGDDYCICVSYQVLKDIDFDTDTNFLTEQYITRVNTLRCNITLLQH